MPNLEWVNLRCWCWSPTCEQAGGAGSWGQTWCPVHNPAWWWWIWIWGHCTAMWDDQTDSTENSGTEDTRMNTYTNSSRNTMHYVVRNRNGAGLNNLVETGIYFDTSDILQSWQVCVKDTIRGEYLTDYKNIILQLWHEPLGGVCPVTKQMHKLSVSCWARDLNNRAASQLKLIQQVNTRWCACMWGRWDHVTQLS